MKKLLFIFLFPILAFGQKAFQPKSNGWWYLQGITTKPTHNLIGVRDSNLTSDKAQIRLFGDVNLNSQIGSGTRMLTVSSAGLISNQAIPSGGGSGTVTTVSGGSTGLSFTTPTTTPTMIGVLNVVSGGSALSTATTGGIRYASATNTLSELAIGTTGKYLTSNGTIPQWSANTFTTDVQGIVNASYIQVLKTFFTDVENATNTETNLIAYTIPANTLNTNGQSIDLEVSLTFTGVNANSRFMFNGVNQYGHNNPNANSKYKITLIREYSTTAKAIMTINTTSTAAGSVFEVILLTGLNFTTTNTISIAGVGQTASTSKVAARSGIVTFIPVQ